MEFWTSLQVMIRPASIATINQYDNISVWHYANTSIYRYI